MFSKFGRRDGYGELTAIAAGSDYDLLPGARYGPIIRNIYIIECCTEGLGGVWINGREFPVKEGDCYILLPGDTIIHTADEVTPRRGYWCALDGAEAGNWLKMAGIRSDAPFAPPEVFREIMAQLKQLFLMREENDPGADLRRSACLYTVFGELLRGRTAAVDKENVVQKAISIMEAKYDQPLTVAEIAAGVGLERCYFSTVFKAGAGISPHRYLTGLRLEKACVLMDQGCTVAEAAVSAGLDPENFARLFKQHRGMTPGEYRRSRKK